MAYDSLGDPLNVSVTMVLESTNSSGTTYRWFADSGNNQPATGQSIAVGTGEVTFDGQGNLVNATNDQVTIRPIAVGGFAAAVEARLFAGLGPGPVNQHAAGGPARRLGGRHALQLQHRQQRRDQRRVHQRRDTNLGQIQLARFANDSGLVQQGQNLFIPGSNSGLPIQGDPGSQGIGSIVAGAVEQSNTDVGQNLINLITASTEYRSGAQVITTVQQLLDTLMQLRPGL